jgi:hypothetical protein
MLLLGMMQPTGRLSCFLFLTRQSCAACGEVRRPAALAAGPAPDDPSLTESMRCTVKTSWDPDVHTYTAEDLRALFSAHGRVVDVVVRERKSAKGASKVRQVRCLCNICIACIPGIPVPNT